MLRFVAVEKARPKRGAKGPASDYETLHRIADEIAPLIEEKFKTGATKMRAKLDVRDILSALADEDGKRIEEGVPWSEIIDQADLRDDLQEVVERSGVASARGLRDLLVRTVDVPEARLEFDRAAPEVEKYARERSGELIKEITDESRQAVRNAVAEALASGKDYGTSAAKIKDAVGLTRVGATAVANYRDGLMEQGLPGPQVARQADAYRERLLKARAENISRTETIAATTQGQKEYWNQLAEDDIIDRDTAEKEWVVTPDDRLCPICEALAGQTVGIDEQFEVDGEYIDGSPAHPGCRCTQALKLRDST